MWQLNRNVFSDIQGNPIFLVSWKSKTFFFSLCSYKKNPEQFSQVERSHFYMGIFVKWKISPYRYLCPASCKSMHDACSLEGRPSYITNFPTQILYKLLWKHWPMVGNSCTCVKCVLNFQLCHWTLTFKYWGYGCERLESIQSRWRDTDALRQGSKCLCNCRLASSSNF